MSAPPCEFCGNPAEHACMDCLGAGAVRRVCVATACRSAHELAYRCFPATKSTPARAFGHELAKHAAARLAPKPEGGPQ